MCTSGHLFNIPHIPLIHATTASINNIVGYAVLYIGPIAAVYESIVKDVNLVESNFMASLTLSPIHFKWATPALV